MKKLTKLYLVRHAEVEETYHRVFAGRMEVGLSATGREQAQHLADYLRWLPLDALYASPMRRVRETLAPLNGHRPAALEFVEGLREFDFGAWTGLNFQQVRERFQAEPWDWLDWIDDGRIPQGENTAQIRARVEPWLQAALARHAGQTLGIFAHGGVIRMLLAILLELPLAKMACFDIEYAGVTEVDLVPGRPAEIQLLNFAPWKMAAANP